MPTLAGLNLTFDTVATAYDKWREEYVSELFQDIFAYKPIHASSNVLEIGIGTGQATKPFLETGCFLKAVETGAELARLCREKFKDYPHFSVITSPFEAFHQADSTYDLIFSASAFHWIPEEVGYTKVFHMLKQGGVFARFANHPYYNKNGQEPLMAEIQKVYDEYMPGSKEAPDYTEEMAIHRSNIAIKYGFAEISYKLYYRTLTYTTE